MKLPPGKKGIISDPLRPPRPGVRKPVKKPVKPIKPLRGVAGPKIGGMQQPKPRATRTPYSPKSTTRRRSF